VARFRNSFEKCAGRPVLQGGTKFAKVERRYVLSHMALVMPWPQPGLTPMGGRRSDEVGLSAVQGYIRIRASPRQTKLVGMRAVSKS
jgi:hypothetical protein